MTLRLKAAVVMGLAVPASMAMAQSGVAQTAGVSHPDEVSVTTSEESGVTAPVYRPTPAAKTPAAKTAAAVPGTASATPGLKPRPGVVAEEYKPYEPLGGGASAGHAVAVHDVDADIVTEIEGPANSLPVGTLVKARIAQGFTTRATAEGSVFSARVTEPVERDGQVLLPVGSVVSGRVTDVHGGRRISGPASIHLQPTTITLPNGTKYALHAQVIDTDLHRQTKVDREGTITRRDHPKETLSVIGLATGSGAAAGAVFGGVPGALIGAGVGAGVSTALWLKQDRQTAVPVDTGVVFALTSAMVVGGS